MMENGSTADEAGPKQAAATMPPPGERRASTPSIIILAALFLFALVSRVQYAHTLVIDLPIRADGISYVNYGANLATRGFLSEDFGPGAAPDSFRSPGYPLLIAAAVLASSPDDCFPLVIYAQALMGAALVLLTFFLGLHFLPRWACLAAAAAVALCPHQTSMASLFMTETQFSFLMAGAALALVSAARNKSLPRAFLAGLLAGLSYLTNETYLFLPMILGGAWLWTARRGSARGGLRPAIVFFCVFLAFPLGWTARNRLGLAAGARTGEGRAYLSFVTGAYPGLSHNGKHSPVWFQEDPQYAAMAKDPAVFLLIMGERIRQNPGRYLLWFVLQKPYYFWRWNMVQGSGVSTYWPERTLYQASGIMRGIRSLMYVVYRLALLMMMAGAPALVWAWRKKGAGPELPAAALVFTHLAYFTALFIIFCPMPRYSVPLRPFLYLGGAYGALALFRASGLSARAGRLSGRAAAAAATAAALLFLLLAAGVALQTRAYAGFSYDKKLVRLPYLNALASYVYGKTAFHTGDYAVARRSLEKSLGVSEFAPQANAMLGRIAYGEGKYPEAAMSFRRTLQKEPGHYESLLGMALCLDRLGRPELSAGYLAEILRRYPGNAQAKNAIEQMRATLLAGPAAESPELIRQRAALLRALGSPGPAAKELEKALDLAPDNPDARAEQALVLSDQGRAKEAERILGDLALRFPGDPGIAFYQARLAARTGNQKEARAFLKKTLDQGFSDRYAVYFHPDLVFLGDLKTAGPPAIGP